MSEESIEEIIKRFDEMMEEEQFEEARALIDEAIKAHPQAALLKASKAELEIEQERYEQSVAIIDELLKEVEERDDDEELLSTVLNLRGYARYYMNDPDDARRTFNRALRHDADNWSALIGRATAHDRMGFLVAALLDLERAIAIDDQDAEPFALRGKIFLKRGELEQASRDFAYALESNPGEEESRLHLARLLARHGNTTDAMELLGPLLEHGEEDDIVATGALLRSQLSMTLGSTEAAAEDARVTIELWPEQPWGYLQLAACQLSSMQAEETIKTLKTAERFVKNVRDVPDIIALRASAYEQLGREDQARRESAKIEGTARLPAVVYGSILNPAQNVPINPDKPVDVRAIMGDLFGHPDRAPKGYEEALREVVDRIPEIIAENPNVERIQIELPQVQGMRGGAQNLVIQVGKQNRSANATQTAEA